MVVAKLSPLFIIIVVSALISACGGGDGIGSSSAQPSTTHSSEAEDTAQPVRVSGYAVKGVISQGIITSWGIEPDGSLVQLGDAVRTSATGFYNLSLPAGIDLIKLELTSDGNTRMRCDAVDGCQGYGGSASASFGENFWPGPNLRLETVVTINDQDDQSLGHLTPLTTLSTTLFEAMGATTGRVGFQQAQQKIEASFGLQAGAVALTPVDITRELPASLTVAELEAALINSAFMGLAEHFPAEGVQGVIDAFRQQLLATGEIADQDAGGSPGSDVIREFAAIHAYTLAGSPGQAAEEVLFSAADRLFGSAEDAGQPDELPIADNEQDTPAPESGLQPEPKPVPEPSPTPEPLPATSTATLTWQAPMTRENGEALPMGDIRKYVVRYGTQPAVAKMTNELIIENGQAMEHKLEGLPEGTWYFAMRTVDQNGLESRWSEVSSETVVR